MDKLKEWEEIIENIEKEEIEAPDAKAIEYDPSDIDSDWDDNDSLDALEEADIDDFEALEKYFHHSKAKKFEITQAKVWIEIAREMQYKSKELFEVITLLLCIPNGTAELERIFSVVKAMKSKKRSKLKGKKLDNMMTIYYFLDLESYDINEVHKIFKQLMN